MRFKDLTPENIEYLRHIYYEQNISHIEKMAILTNKFKCSERTVRRWWKEKLRLSELLSKLPKQIQEARDRVIPKDTDILLVTSAQNKTAINLDFLSNMVTYSEKLTELGYKVEIVVAPTRYRNPTNPIENEKEKTEEWWVDEVLPYLHHGKLQFGDTLISTESRIRPTASNPLMGYEVLAKNNHLVLPHSKIHFKTMPRVKNNPLRTMSSTGYITHKNYSDSKSGEKAYEHHSFGFVIIEKKKDGTCHTPRNVKVKDDGSFIDLIYSVDGSVKKIEHSEGFVWGDIHAAVVNREIFDITLNLYDLFKPKKTVLHDLYDGSCINPHEVKDMYIQRRKIIEKRYLVEDEIQHSFDLLSEIVDTGSDVYVTLSNHDVFLDRYINDGNWKKDLHNSPAYLKYSYIQQTEDLSEIGTVYGWLLKKEFKNKVTYLNYGSSLDIMGYACAMHGDHGSNGSRGTYRQFSKLNTKMISAHSHSPIIYDGVTVVGITCNKDQYYTRKGLSSWAYAHSVIHPNGKNQLLVFGDDYKISELL